ncbi:hypothetical protein BAC1_00270 [uncultured bacterium]|nr:hypothetical protein BAC1_00270 [uncultured bacterium]
MYFRFSPVMLNSFEEYDKILRPIREKGSRERGWRYQKFQLPVIITYMPRTRLVVAWATMH